MTNIDEAMVKNVDTIWCRLLCVLERIEIIHDDGLSRTTLCHDIHEDKDNPIEPLSDMVEEFELQLSAFSRAVTPITSHNERYKNDLIEWFAGRKQTEESVVDELVIKVASKLCGIKVDTIDTSSPSDDSGNAPTNLGGNIGISKIDGNHNHSRGSLNEGITRFSSVSSDQELQNCIGRKELPFDISPPS